MAKTGAAGIWWRRPVHQFENCCGFLGIQADMHEAGASRGQGVAAVAGVSDPLSQWLPLPLQRVIEAGFDNNFFVRLQLGHMPQEDYAEAILKPILEFIESEE
jgi:hypothetical protein